MPKYGQIVSGELITSEILLQGYKPIEYAEIPEFDQMTHAVYQGEIKEDDDNIYVGIEIKEVQQDENNGDEDIFRFD